MNSEAPKSLRSGFALLSDHQIAGFVYDLDNRDERFVVELLLDGYPAAITRAQHYDYELDKSGIGDGCYRFLFTIEPEALRSTLVVEVRLANLGLSLGAPIAIDGAKTPAGTQRAEASVRWLGGLRLTGWTRAAGEGRASSFRAYVDGALVGQVRPTLWTHVGDGDDAVAVRGFDVTLPLHLADGKVRRVHVFDDAGAELAGSPCTFFAFPDGLERFLEGRADIQSEKLRGRLFDRLIPQSIPFDMFEAWRTTFPIRAAAPERTPRFAIALMGEDDIEASVESLKMQTGCDWVAGALERDGGQTAFRNESLRQFLDTEARDREILVFALSGTLFREDALLRIAEAAELFPLAERIYSDIEIPGADGEPWPIAFPAFDYERMLEQGYPVFLFAMKAESARAAAESGVGDLYRLFNHFLDDRSARDPARGGAHAPVHVPGFLARAPRPELGDGSLRLARATQDHLRARGMAATVRPAYGALFPAARVTRAAPRGRVSILIPTRNRLDLLEPCLQSLRASVDFARHEVLVINNDSSDPEILSFLSALPGQGVRVVNAGGAFNFARIVGAGASIASGEFLLLLNNDVKALNPGWLEEMLGRMAESDVGAVGATLIWPSRVVQHGGVVLGPNFGAVHAFNDRMDGDAGYADLLAVAHEASAVTAACLLTRRSLFLDLGGFDGVHFPVNFNDVDFCLRLRARGYRVVMTPHAKLLHRESASRGNDTRPDAAGRFEKEMRNLRSAWGEALMDDPYYNPLLSLDQIPFSALAWPPRSVKPRQSKGLRAVAIPPGF